MRIGVFLGGFSPEAGGGYTFQTDVFTAFLQHAGASKHAFTVVCDSPLIASFAESQPRPSNVDIARIAPRGWLERISSTLKRELPISRRFLSRAGRVETAAVQAEADLVWFVGSGVYEPMDVPYVATVWDLQHRSHPWFPEVSAGGVWDGREQSVRSFLQRAAYVIVGTDAGAEEACLYCEIPKDRICKLPHPTPSFALAVKSKPGFDTLKRLGLDPGYLFYPAQFWPHKNHVNLILALKHAKDEFNIRPQLVLVGSDKGNLPHVRQLVNVLGLESQVRFLGFVAQEDLVALYQQADMMVYPSFCGPENLPPLEAFALGCPVVAANIPGAREQLNGSAVLVEPCDPASIAAGIRDIRDDPMLRNRLIEQGRARASRWTSREFVDGVFRLFDEFATIRRTWAPIHPRKCAP